MHGGEGNLLICSPLSRPAYFILAYTNVFAQTARAGMWWCILLPIVLFSGCVCRGNQTRRTAIAYANLCCSAALSPPSPTGSERKFTELSIEINLVSEFLIDWVRRCLALISASDRKREPESGGGDASASSARKVMKTRVESVRETLLKLCPRPLSQ